MDAKNGLSLVLQHVFSINQGNAAVKLVQMHSNYYIYRGFYADDNADRHQ